MSRAGLYLTLASALLTACGADTVGDVVNQPPVAELSGGNRTATVGAEITFNGSNSSDPDGTIAGYTWDFGDGTPLLDAGASVGHIYNAQGFETVTLTVTDDDGDTSIPVSVEVTINPSSNNIPPEVEVFGAAVGVLPTAVIASGTTLTYTGVATDEDGTVETWTWNFGDGTLEDAGVIQGDGSNQVLHEFTNTSADNRILTVTLTVVDNDGTSANDTATVTVQGTGGGNLDPDVDIYGTAIGVLPPAVIADGVSVPFTGVATDSDGVIATWTWNFGDGTPEEVGVIQVDGSNQLSHVFNNAAVDDVTYVITLTVTDNDGGSGSDIQNVLVEGTGTTTGTYDGMWFWSLDAGEPADPGGTGMCVFQDSELNITTGPGTAITIDEIAGGVTQQTYTGTLTGTTFNATYGTFVIQTIAGEFTTEDTFVGTYSLATGGIFPECDVPRAVSGFKQ